MELNVQEVQEGITLITLGSILDSATLQSLRDRIDQLLDANRCRIILDCSKLAFVSSAGIGAIVSLHRRVQEAGGKFGGESRGESGGESGGDSGGQLWIAGATGAVFEVLELMNLGSILNLSDDVEHARLALGPTEDHPAG